MPDSSRARGMRRSEPALKPRKGIRSNAFSGENPYFLVLFALGTYRIPKGHTVSARAAPSFLACFVLILFPILKPLALLGERNREFARNCPSHSFSQPNGGLRREYRDHLNPQIHPLQKCEQPFPESHGNGQLPGSLTLGTPMPRSLGNPVNPDYRGWYCGQTSLLQLVNSRWKIDRANVHLCSDILIHHIDHEFVGVADILRRVLANDSRRRPISHADGDNCWIRSEIVVGTKGRRVQPAFAVQAGDQSNWTRSNQADEQVVGLSL